MPNVRYGTQIIEYSFLEKGGLKSHYISVEKGVGVVLKGGAISVEKSQQLILKKARWILDKLDLVSAIGYDDIVTGSRIQYLGRKYYVQIYINDERSDIEIDFTESKFKIYTSHRLNNQQDLQLSLEYFFKERAIIRITPRVHKWSKVMKLPFNQLKFMKLEKRWGSCTPSNNIIINIDVIKLPFSLIDYLIVHELSHTKIKNHSKEFWAEVSKYLPNWKELDNSMYGVKL